MCVILFIHIYISRNIYVFHVYIYIQLYTHVWVHIIYISGPWTFIVLSKWVCFAVCTVLHLNAETRFCRLFDRVISIPWCPWPNKNVRHCWIQNYFGWIHTPIENYYWRGDKAFEIIGQCFQRLCFWEFAEGLWPRPLDCPGCNRPRPKQKWPWKLRSWEFLHEERQIGT